MRRESKTQMDLRLLDKAIVHWETDNFHVKELADAKLGVAHCPLCLVYHTDEGCSGCPIRIFTRRNFCHRTPYDKIEAALEGEDIDFHKECVAEIKFLKKLRAKLCGTEASK